jgi:hypothetical protein
MAWNKKDAEVVLILRDINEKAIFRNVHRDVLTSPKRPFALENKLSPLTIGFEKERAIDYGIFILIQSLRDRSAREVIDSIASSLRSQNLRRKEHISALHIVVNLTIFCDALRNAVNEVGALKNDMPQIIKIFDVLILQSIASIPVIGPSAAGLSGTTLSLAYQGIMTTLTLIKDRKKADLEQMAAAAALAFAGGGVNYEGDKTNKAFDPQAKPSNAQLFAQKEGGAMGKAGDVKSPGIVEFIYAVYDESQNDAREDAGKEIKNDINVVNQDLLTFANPGNQAVAAANQLARGFVDNCSSKTIADRIAKSGNKQAKNCSEFFNNLAEMSRDLIVFFESVTDDAIVASFAPLLSSMKGRVAQIGSMPPNTNGQRELRTCQFNRDEDYIAAVIAGWFLKNSITEDTKQLIEHAYPWIRGAGAGNVGAVHSLKHLKDRGLLGKGDITTENVITDKMFSNSTFQNVGRRVEDYVTEIRNAVAETLNDVFKAAPGPDDLKDIVSLQITCTNIVSECYKRAVAKQDLEIDEKYIKKLEALKYVKTYSKTFFMAGQVTDSKKRDLTRERGQGGAPDIWTLRYPLGKGRIFSATASVKESAMIYAFAVLVTQYVDILRISAGLDDLKIVKDNLNNAIRTINVAANNDLYNV